MVVPVPGHSPRPGVVAIESAFAEHLRMLRTLLGPLATELVVAGPLLGKAQYEAQRGQLAELDAEKDGIRFRAVFPLETGRLGYWLRIRDVMKALEEEVREADVVHAGCSSIFRPFEFPALVLGKRFGKTTISVSDIDNRATPRMKRAIGEWGLREYLWTKAIHSTWNHLQQRYAVQNFSLVLLKGLSFAKDYGRERRNVEFFLDSAFSEAHIITPERLEQKIAHLRSEQHALRSTYFGRLVPYKGVDRMLVAHKVALDQGANVHFRIIGDGPQAPALKQQAAELGIQDHVEFLGAVPFGPRLFDYLYDSDLLLAAPLSEDTPRSALDAAAAGMSLLAFDTSYYCDLARLGAPVTTVTWPDATELGNALAKLAGDRHALADSARRAVAFACDNTQEIWLKRRIEWTRTAATAAS
jgi:glycosyltransferase involved in cell wall biosynthesis